MIKIQKQKMFVTIPSAFISDSDLSLEAKGLMTWFYSLKDNKTDYNIILDTTKSLTKAKLSKVISELSEAGYIIQLNEEDIEVTPNPKRKKEKIVVDKEKIKTTTEIERSEVKSKSQSRWDRCKEAIVNYTKDPELQELLLEYLYLRLNPGIDSRLHDKPLQSSTLWAKQLETLNTMKGDKKKIVERSIVNHWAKFVDIKEEDNKSKLEQSNVKNTRYSEEEIEEIKRKAADMNKSGERRGSF